MKKSFLFISCEEAAYICDKTQYNEASAWERFKLNLRLSWCSISRTYSKNNDNLTNAIEKAKADCLKPEEKQELLESFEKELSKHKE